MWFFIMACFVAVEGNHLSSACPVEITPPRAVVTFGGPLLASCTALTDQIQGMGWESMQGGKPLTTGVTSLALNISAVTDWGLSAFCFLNHRGDQCKTILPITVYKTPDNVSMVHDAGPFVEGQKYEMQCNVFNVAPVNRLHIRWYKGTEILATKTFDDTTRTPVNKLSVLTLVAHRDDHERFIWCEAALIFGVGTDPPPSPSQAFKFEVLFPPTLSNATHEELEMRDDGPLLLNCTASGNPAVVYSWSFPHSIQPMDTNQTTNQLFLEPYLQFPGVFTCNVSNSRGTATKTFTVIEPESRRTTFAGIVGGILGAGVLFGLVGLHFVTADGSFASNKGSYQPTSSGPV